MTFPRRSLFWSVCPIVNMTFSVFVLCSLLGTALSQMPSQGLIGNNGQSFGMGMPGFGPMSGFIDFDIDHPLSDVDSSVLAQRFMNQGSSSGFLGQEMVGPSFGAQQSSAGQQQGFSGQQGFSRQQQSFDGHQGFSGSVSVGSSASSRGQISLNPRADTNSRDSFLTSFRGQNSGSQALSDIVGRSSTRTLGRSGGVSQPQFSNRGSRLQTTRLNIRQQPQRSVVDSRRSGFGSRNLGASSRRVSLGSRGIHQRGLIA